jgi:hypothetical protein
LKDVLTRPVVRFAKMSKPLFVRTASPEAVSTMKTDTEVVVQTMLVRLVDHGESGEVEATVQRIVKLCQLGHVSHNGFHTAHLFSQIELLPNAAQRDACSRFHDYILAANGVQRIIVPVDDTRNRDTGIFLH